MQNYSKRELEIKNLYEAQNSQGEYLYEVVEIAEAFDMGYDTLRKWIRNQPWYIPDRRARVANKIMRETAFDATLTEHGYDPDKYELVPVGGSKWEQQGEDGVKTLSSFRFNVKPKDDPYSELINFLRDETIPLDIKRESRLDTSTSILIALNDIHMGSMTYQDYLDTQDRILDLIDEGHDQVLIWLGGDLFDTDNFRGTTASGTYIDDINFPQAWHDLTCLVAPIITQAVKKSDCEVVMTRGNHSESMEWAFMQYLRALIPQAKYDDGLEYIKARVLGGTFVGLSHGNVNPKTLAINFSKRFPSQWAHAVHHEMNIGHEHKLGDIAGMLLVRHSSYAKQNDWSKSMGFTDSTKKLQVRRYDASGLDGVDYV